jgi:hypothetical protein
MPNRVDDHSKDGSVGFIDRRSFLQTGLRAGAAVALTAAAGATAIKLHAVRPMIGNGTSCWSTRYRRSALGFSGKAAVRRPARLSPCTSRAAASARSASSGSRALVRP